MSINFTARPATTHQEKRLIARRLLKEGYGYEDLVQRLAEGMRRDPYEQGAVPLDTRTYDKIMTSGDVPDGIKRVLTTSATALIRQDLEPTLYALFVTEFPAWDRFTKEESNGLVHAYNQITAPGSSTTAQITITELGTVVDDTSTYARQTTEIAVLATRRGVSIKQDAAVRQGGAPYNVQAEEIANGTITLAQAMQNLMFHGNQSGANPGSDSQEVGLYNANGFDGLRMVVGSVAPYGSNNAIQLELGNYTMMQAINKVTASIMDNGRRPTAVYCTAAALDQLINEQLPQVRYNDPGQEIVPGVTVPTVNSIGGRLPVIAVPGTFIGSYANAASVTVDDVYVLDERSISLPWLASDTFTVLEIPIGANGQLSSLFILFGMFGLAVKAALWTAKIRRPV